MTSLGAWSRLLCALRSRRLAITLLAALTVYAFVGTLVPRGAPDDPEVSQWSEEHPLVAPVASAVGLHEAYAAPLFLVFAALLASSTTLCAVERTGNARRTLRAAGALSKAGIERLRTHPRTAIVLAEGITPESAVARAAHLLRQSGIRMRSGPELMEGVAGVWGVIGSPLFHWSIAALIVVIAAGQSTRAEGVLGLPVGQRVADTHASYLQLSEGPFFGERHTGLGFEASDVIRRYTVDGVDMGPAPIVTAFRDGVEVASRRVYPNSPLRIGPIMLHMADLGPAAVMVIEDPAGGEIAREMFLLDRSKATSSGTQPQTFTLGAAGTGGASIAGWIEVVVRRGPSSTGTIEPSRAIIATGVAGSGAYGAPITVAEGEAVTLPSGQLLRLVSVGDWVRVSVANDWSVPAIYVLLTTAILGLAIAVLVPVRRVGLLLVEKADGWLLHATVWHSQRDPRFTERVEAIVREAAGGGGTT